MKKLILLIGICLILGACKTPDYGAEKENNHKIEIAKATEVATFNGYVIEVTEDNVIRIKVPRKGDLIEKGFVVNKEGVIEVALASIQLPGADMPFAPEITAALKTLLIDKEVTFQTMPGEQDLVNGLLGYINVENGSQDYLIQDVLLKNGLAIIDKSRPYSEERMKIFEDLQGAAQNESLGIWAVDEFVQLSNTFEGQFTALAKEREALIYDALVELKESGWTIENLVLGEAER